eukprot:801836_1
MRLAAFLSFKDFYRMSWLSRLTALAMRHMWPALYLAGFSMSAGNFSHLGNGGDKPPQIMGQGGITCCHRISGRFGRSHTTLVRLNPSECTLSWGRRRVSCCLRATTRTLRIKSVISGRGDIARFECYEPDDGRCLVVTGVEKYIAGHRNLYIQLIAPSQRLRDNWVNHLSRYLEQFKGKRTSSYKKW